MPHRQTAPSRARRQTTPKRRWTAAERAERDRRDSARREDDRRSGDRRSSPRPSAGEDRTTGRSWTSGRRPYGDERAGSERTGADQRRGGDRGSSDRTWNDRGFDNRRTYDRRSDDRRSDDRRSDERRSDDRRWNERGPQDRRSDDRSAQDRRSDDRRWNDRSDERRPSNQRRTENRRPSGTRSDRRPTSWSRPSGDDRPPSSTPSAGEFAVGSALVETLDTGIANELQNEATAPEPVTTTFAELGLPSPIVETLARGGIVTPFPIQAATIPDALAGRDVLGRGQTGSGKTLSFGLPMLARLSTGGSRRPGQARGVVLLPTRELAMQVADALTPLAASVQLGVALVAGGMAYGPQLRAFEQGVDVVVATPGRLIDLMERGAADLGSAEVLVLDEADHMADLGFLPEVTAILDAVPAGGQRLLFSATLDNAIAGLVERYLESPVTRQVDSGRASVSTMDHRILHVLPREKQQIFTEIAGRDGRTVVFARTQLGAERIAEQLRDSGVLAGALHGGLSQSIRTRILAAFKEGELPVLVATDVAARGIHVDDVGLVLQVDPPAGPKEYLHRAGRTARAGGTGVVVTLALPQQRREVGRLTAQAGVRTEPIQAVPGDAALAAVTGARVPAGPAITRADYDRVIAPRRPARRPRNDRPGKGRPRARSDRARSDRSGADRARHGSGSGPRP